MRREDGITLVEVVIGMALLSSAMITASLTFTSISKLQQKGATQRAVQQNGRYVLEGIARDIRNAKAAAVNSPTALTLQYNQNLNGQAATDVNYTFANNAILRNGVSVTDGVFIQAVRYQNLAPAGDKEALQVDMAVWLKQPGSVSSSDPYAYAYSLSTVATLRGK